MHLQRPLSLLLPVAPALASAALTFVLLPLGSSGYTAAGRIDGIAMATHILPPSQQLFATRPPLYFPAHTS
jgi:hypothetical protein